MSKRPSPSPQGLAFPLAAEDHDDDDDGDASPTPPTYDCDSDPDDAAGKSQVFRLYCDLDGVLCDFGKGLADMFGDEVGGEHGKFQLKSEHWARICSSTNFFDKLPWTVDGPALWNAINHLPVSILTGVPAGAARCAVFSLCQNPFCKRPPSIPLSSLSSRFLSL